ncbi:MAG: tyrosine--tRNA ligase [Endomicrobium sp.]|jgi:tyrosyl-tRNA synthetase|nr:tyrosine--tRNA ligase [Endomicrobium sp.]
MKDFLKVITKGIDEIISFEELKSKIATGKELRIKFGIDPTTSNLHLGHSVIINKLKTFQEMGHKIIFLIGDFTAKIGDPSGRSQTRQIMTDKQININMKTYTDYIFKIINKEKTEIVYNSKWFKNIGIDGILKLATKSTVAKMLTRDDFRKRYKNNISISIIEFIYPLLQAYDSVVLNADIELGGKDQKFNLLLTREIQKSYGIKNVQVVITMPLLEGISGVRKMSKSYNNCIALNEPPKNMFGKVMSISDSLMYKYYELLTQNDLRIIKNMHPKYAKLALAEEIVEKYHGKNEALKAKKEFCETFIEKKIPNNIDEYVFKSPGMKLSSILTTSNMVISKNEARRLIKQGAVKIDSIKIEKDFWIKSKKRILLQVGKRKFKRIILL